MSSSDNDAIDPVSSRSESDSKSKSSADITPEAPPPSLASENDQKDVAPSTSSAPSINSATSSNSAPSVDSNSNQVCIAFVPRQILWRISD